MSKSASILLILAIVIIGLVGYKIMQDSYKILPVGEQQISNLTAFDFQNWHEFTAPSGTFKVLFPALPQHATENINDPETKDNRKYDMYVSEKENGSTFMITLITFTGASVSTPSEREGLLKEMMKDMVAANPNNKLIHSESGTYKGHPSLDFILNSGEITIDAKTFIVGDTLYVLSRIEKQEKDNQSRDEFLFFVNSFELMNPSQKPAAPAKTK